MNKRKNLALLFLLFFAGHAHAELDWLQKRADLFKTLDGSKQTSTLDAGDVEKAFKEALRIGSNNVVSKLSAVDGFNADPEVRIPLPKKLGPVKKVLKKIGMRKDVDRFEKKLNRAAEVAVPKAKTLFLQSISKMTFKDIMDIYEGPKDSATKYFRKQMSPSLRKEMRPIVEGSLSEVGAIKAFKKLMKKYKKIPYAPKVKADIVGYVVQKGMDGVFYYLAKEEEAIRKNPEKRTTDLLKAVFGGK